MLLQHLERLNAGSPVLASASPQRLRILEGCGLRCKVAGLGATGHARSFVIACTTHHLPV